MQDLAAVKERLLGEITRIETELGQFAEQDPDAEGNFTAKVPQYGDSEDENVNEVADYSDRLSLEKELEESLGLVNHALERLEAGQYGVCESCGLEIPEARLAVQPMATMCMACKERLGE